MKTSILLIFLLLFFSSCSKQKTKPLYTLMLSDKGINTLTSSTPFLQNSIAPKLKGYDIKLFSAFEAGDIQTIMRVSYYDEEVMLLFPTKKQKDQEQTIQSISITSKLVEHPFAIKIGDRYRSDLHLTCNTNKERMFCSTQKHKHIQLIFTLNDTTQWQLEEILWNKDALQ